MRIELAAFSCLALIAAPTASASSPPGAFRPPADPATYVQQMIASGLPAEFRQELTMMTCQFPQTMVPIVYDEIERLRKLRAGERYVTILCHTLAATTEIKALERLMTLVESDFERFSPHIVEFLGHARTAGEAFRLSYSIVGRRGDTDALLRTWLASNCVTEADRRAALEAARERGADRRVQLSDPVMALLPSVQQERVLEMSRESEGVER